MPCLLVTGDWFVWWLDLLVAWSVVSFCLICCFRGWVWGGLASVAVCYVFVALIVVCRAVWFLWVGGYLVFCVWVGL